MSVSVDKEAFGISDIGIVDYTKIMRDMVSRDRESLILVIE